MPMYKVKPVSPADIKIDVPSCMYKSPNVHAHGMNCGEHALQVINITDMTRQHISSEHEIVKMRKICNGHVHVSYD